jgi:hypothetical protein
MNAPNLSGPPTKENPGRSGRGLKADSSLSLATTTKTARIQIYLQSGPEPDRGGIGAVYPRITRDGSRQIQVKLYAHNLLVSRAIARSDLLLIRFLASTLLWEFFSRYGNNGRSPELFGIRSGLIARLGGPWEDYVNLTFLTAELAKNELSSKLEPCGIFACAKAPKDCQPWFSFGCERLPEPSTLWQWNPQLQRPAAKVATGKGVLS